MTHFLEVRGCDFFKGYVATEAGVASVWKNSVKPLLMPFELPR